MDPGVRMIRLETSLLSSAWTKSQIVTQMVWAARGLLLQACGSNWPALGHLLTCNILPCLKSNGMSHGFSLDMPTRGAPGSKVQSAQAKYSKAWERTPQRNVRALLPEEEMKDCWTGTNHSSPLQKTAAELPCSWGNGLSLLTGCDLVLQAEFAEHK